MGLLESATEKANAVLAKAQDDIVARANDAHRAQDSLEQVERAASDKATAARSAQEAEIKDLEVQIRDAKNKLESDRVVADLVRKVTDLPLISGPTESIRTTCDAIVAQDQAEADALVAQLSAAKADLSLMDTGDEGVVQAAAQRVSRAQSRLAMAQTRQQLAQSALTALGKLTETAQ